MPSSGVLFSLEYSGVFRTSHFEQSRHDVHQMKYLCARNLSAGCNAARPTCNQRCCNANLVNKFLELAKRSVGIGSPATALGRGPAAFLFPLFVVQFFVPDATNLFLGGPTFGFHFRSGHFTAIFELSVNMVVSFGQETRSQSHHFTGTTVVRHQQDQPVVANAVRFELTGETSDILVQVVDLRVVNRAAKKLFRFDLSGKVIPFRKRIVFKARLQAARTPLE